MTSVLVVDDSAMVRHQVQHALSEAGFAVTTAVDGLDAAEKLSSEPSIALVVCDVNMPRLGGLELLEQLREAGNQVTFLMLTTEGQPEFIARARTLGAKVWMVKPFQPALLVAAVRKLTAA